MTEILDNKIQLRKSSDEPELYYITPEGLVIKVTPTEADALGCEILDLNPNIKKEA